MTFALVRPNTSWRVADQACGRGGLSAKDRSPACAHGAVATIICN